MEIILYAVPNPVTIPDYHPTYYVNKLKLNDAAAINLKKHILDIDIYLQSIPNSQQGTASIQGRFNYADKNTDDTTSFEKNWFGNSSAAINPIYISGQPCKNMPIVLYDENNQPIKSTTTDTEGYYQFYNLSFGSYKIEGQRYGYHSENDGAVALESQIPEVVSLKMIKSITGLTESPENSLNSELTIYPNPFSESISIKGYIGKVSISDVTGRIIYENLGSENISTISWPDGVYFVKLENKVQKIVKQ